MLDFKVKLHKFHLGWVSASDFTYKVFELSEGCGSNLYNCFLNPLMPTSVLSVMRIRIRNRYEKSTSKIGTDYSTALFQAEIGLHVTTMVTFDWLWYISFGLIYLIYL